MPKWRSLERLSDEELGILREKLDDLLKRGYIRPSTSPFGAAILFVKKADGSLRLCIDYRGLNAVTVKNRCPIPHIDELRERVRGAAVFSKIDLRDGYYNLRVHASDVFKTAFRCRYGHFEFTVMPFGLANAPAVFTAMMNRILRPFLDRFVIAYLDDIIIYSKNPEEHNNHLKQIFQTIRDNKLALKQEKCSFGLPEVAFCGHLIGITGISLMEEKKEAMKKRPVLNCPKDIRSWVGSCVWFKDFIPGFAEITRPLTDLTRKAAIWNWTPECDHAVSTLITRITEAPVLRHFDSNRPTHVYTDASLFAIGGWIGQEHADGIHPTVYWSRKLLDAERNYPVHERELLALVEMLSRFGHLLRGVKFRAWTDHKSLRVLQTQPHLSYRQARWVLLLQEYDFEIEYLPGQFNNVADYLSRSAVVAPRCTRCNLVVNISAMTTTGGSSWVGRIRQAARSDLLARKVFNAHLTRPDHEVSLEHQELIRTYSVRHGMVYKGQKLYIPDDDALRTSLLHRYHDNAMAGHQGKLRTLERIGRHYYWPGMKEDVDDYVQTCDTCQRFNASNKKPVGELHPLPIPTQRFQDISMDFAALPRSTQGNDSVLVIIDRLTKLCAFIPGRKTDKAEQVAERFLQGWFCKGAGLPTSVVSDRDSRFLSEFWKTLCTKLQITAHLTTARHQQADGQAERTVGIMKGILKKYVERGEMNWETQLPWVEFAINNSVSSSTGFTPFMLTYGFNPREPDVVGEDERFDLLQRRADCLSLARDNLYHAQDLQALDFDRRHDSPPVYRPGDSVLLAAEGISWPADVLHPPVFHPRWLGPFKIRTCDDARRHNYELELPSTLSKLHPIFHVSKLRPYRLSKRFRNRPGQHRPAPVLGADGKARFDIDQILDKRCVKPRGQGHEKKFYLVKWVGYPSHEADWIEYTDDDPEWDDDRDKILRFERNKNLVGVS